MLNADLSKKKIFPSNNDKTDRWNLIFHLYASHSHVCERGGQFDLFGMTLAITNK